MTKTLIVAAAFGLSLSAANACEFMRSAEAPVDQTVVASIATEDAMSTPETLILPQAPATDQAPVESVAE